MRDDRALWDGQTLREWAEVIVDRLVTRFAPARIILFGSVADGTDGPDSDIDLLVVLDDAPLAERPQIMVELRRATRGVAAPHDLLVTSVADLDRNRTRPGSTEYEPARQGIAGYERVGTCSDELVSPEAVSVAMAEIGGAVREGLLALAVAAGLQVMGAMMEESVIGPPPKFHGTADNLSETPLPSMTRGPVLYPLTCIPRMT